MTVWTLASFYKSKDWERFREILIDERTDPETGLVYCAHCGKPIAKAYDIIGHHVNELTEQNVNDRTISLNPDNVVLVHHKCHNEIHERFGYNRAAPRKVYIVYGPPLAGKSTWVRDTAGSKDIILDIDRLWEMISNNPPYIKPPELKTCVFSLRDRILEIIQTRQGKWKNAYIVGGYPIPREREELASKLCAELIPIIEPQETCLDRLAECKDGRDYEAWARYIRDWFDRAA